MKATPHSVLQGLSGWDDATVSELKGGTTNRTWLVKAGRKKAVLKIDDRPRRPPYNSRIAEAEIQSAAAAGGIASRVLFASDTVYLTEYLEGSVWQLTDLDNDGNLESLAHSLRKLHALPLTGRTFDAVGAAHNYASRIANADASQVRDCLRAIEAMPLPHNLCCCHNDLVAGNIIATPEVRFLDWEYACDNDPFFDLATVVAHHKLSAERADYLLNAYFNGDGDRWRRQLARQAEFYEALLWLWEAARS